MNSYNYITTSLMSFNTTQWHQCFITILQWVWLCWSFPWEWYFPTLMAGPGWTSCRTWVSEHHLWCRHVSIRWLYYNYCSDNNIIVSLWLLFLFLECILKIKLLFLFNQFGIWEENGSQSYNLWCHR
jgi:hypothetical protein